MDVHKIVEILVRVGSGQSVRPAKPHAIAGPASASALVIVMTEVIVSSDEKLTVEVLGSEENVEVGNGEEERVGAREVEEVVIEPRVLGAVSKGRKSDEELGELTLVWTLPDERWLLQRQPDPESRLASP